MIVVDVMIVEILEDVVVDRMTAETLEDLVGAVVSEMIVAADLEMIVEAIAAVVTEKDPEKDPDLMTGSEMNTADTDSRDVPVDLS